ncbi:hypothetical protein SUGI_0087770 [Cryptomeria japonica]|uniref:probable LRR receptor-like serine/threonine-protein kinase At4g36180 n=1 Tax=Cryptomeria japonica TaxID=3369 RepID=UPI002408B8FA|nr:probable LRR receptor-like serine/threonine-protein kinase At4g36180 [Cryptomeria japonica]GLJ08384.1 hypothetical protein SUGI_0087770 [Cryptomeria japonica]
MEQSVPILIVACTILTLGSSILSATLPSDIQALIHFKNSIDKSSVHPTSCLDSWDFSAADPCVSTSAAHFACGLLCDVQTGEESRVTSITLDGAGYKGFLHPSIGNLSELVKLDVSGNAFSGAIPETIGLLSKLTSLKLANNQFSGSLPSSIGGLVSLQGMSLARNQLDGFIPQSLNGLVDLRSMDLSHNSFSGVIPPFRGMRSMHSLDASYNKLTGELHAELPPLLSLLILRGNMLNGSLPAKLNSLPRLSVLDVASNKLSGSVGSTLFGHPSLQQVNLSNNNFGALSVPNLAGVNAQMVAFDISFNRINGSLPANFASIGSLAALYLSHNQFQGPIPADYGRKTAMEGSENMRPLYRLYLESNYLSGDIPAVFLGISPGKIIGSFADNCLNECPARVTLCQGGQRPPSECRTAY